MHGRSNSFALFDTADLSSQTGWAAVVYSAVPYLGVLFIPIAVAVSVVGLLRGRGRSGKSHNGKFLIVSLLLLGIQLYLWWLLYIARDLPQNF